MALLLFGSLPDSLLVLVDAVYYIGVVVRNVQHFRGFVARHAKLLNHKNELQSVLV